MNKMKGLIATLIALAMIFCLAPTSMAAGRQQKLNPGELVTFGAYEQDGKIGNGQENIEWIVLAVNDDSALLISRYVLDCCPYNEKWKDMTWKLCTLRNWLNDSFLATAFSDEEQSAILVTRVDNSTNQGNPTWNKNGGYNTDDSIFLLSYAEMKDYFDTDKERISRPTEYALKRGVWQDTNKACHWWLRSPGATQNYAAYTSSFGSLSSTYNCNAAIGVRPAIWVKLDAIVLDMHHSTVKPNSDLESTTLNNRRNVIQELWTPLRGDGAIWLISKEKFSKLNGSIVGHTDYAYEYIGGSLRKAIVGDPSSTYSHQEILFAVEGTIESTTVYEGDRVVLEQKNNQYGDPTEITFFGCQYSKEYITSFHGNAISTSFFTSDDSSCRIDYIGSRIQIVLNPSQKALINYNQEHLIESITYYDLAGKRLSESYIIYDASNNSYQLDCFENESFLISYANNGLPDKVRVISQSAEKYLHIFHYDSEGHFDFIEHINDGQLRAREQFDYSVKNGYAIEYWIEDEESKLFQKTTCVYVGNGQIERCNTTFYLDDGRSFGNTVLLAYDENGNITHYQFDFGGITEDREFSYIRYK